MIDWKMRGTKRNLIVDQVYMRRSVNDRNQIDFKRLRALTMKNGFEHPMSSKSPQFGRLIAILQKNRGLIAINRRFLTNERYIAIDS